MCIRDKFCFFWGIAGVVWLKGVYPYLSKWIEKIPMLAGKIIKMCIRDRYYYTIVPALAMSKNYKNAERIKSREGKVVSKERKGSTFEIYVEFEN